VLWKPIEQLRFGISYTTSARIHAKGRGFVDASKQFESLGGESWRDDVTYDAEVTNDFPQVLTGGFLWKATRKLNIAGQVDWINWADSFDQLDLRLTDSNNDDVNRLIGQDYIHEKIPLEWRDQLVWRFGMEYAVTEQWSIRGGYFYGRSAVPSRTLTPMTAAILEHTVTAGIGYSSARISVDLGWQWNLPAEQHVGKSKLASEYSGSETKVGVHWIGVTTSVSF
jgi:long-subunit fatty acid transport protein